MRWQIVYLPNNRYSFSLKKKIKRGRFSLASYGRFISTSFTTYGAVFCTVIICRPSAGYFGNSYLVLDIIFINFLWTSTFIPYSAIFLRSYLHHSYPARIIVIAILAQYGLTHTGQHSSGITFCMRIRGHILHMFTSHATKFRRF